ncbi:MAG: hypothetical protein MI892_23045 [Desulfobacterales bacterium]|nr:hypothetical protein [Desulfobacterales bacterium]
MMEPILCPFCDTFFTPRNKLQTVCTKPECQKARKALWQRNKLATDPEYEKGQRLANQKWLANNPDYWTRYRRKNPKKADKNRAMQRVRNQKTQPSKTIGIAKMDSGKSFNQGLLGTFWLIPTIAKMDPVKIFITTAPGCSP